jgi:hypothetical protein
MHRVVAVVVSVKVAVSVKGRATPPPLGVVTVAVKVTAAPRTDGFALEARVVAVASFTT